MNAGTEVREQRSEVGNEVKPGPVEELAAVQAAHGLPDGAFAQQVRLGYSGSSWGKLKAGNFPGNMEKALRAVRKALSNAQGGLDPARGRFVVFEHVRGVLDGIELAEGRAESPNRLVLFVASMGMGKSELCRVLGREHGATVIEGQPSWGSSYMAALRDLAAGLGIDDRFPGRHDGERLILRELKAAPRLLVVDEANYFTTEGLNFMKAVLNQTRCVVVLATLPEDYTRWTAANRHPSRQLVRRSVGIFRAPPVSARDVRSMQAAGWPELHLNGSAGKVASAANKFGGLDLVVRILEEMDPEEPDGAEGAIERVLDMLEQGGGR